MTSTEFKELLIQHQLTVNTFLDLRDIWNILGEIIGESYTEELLDELFSKFCVGK